MFPLDSPSYDINYDELLSYARRISKTTMPPAGALNGLKAEVAGSNEGAGGATDTAATTPAGGTPNGTQSQPPALANGAVAAAQQDPTAQPTVAVVGPTDGTTATTTVQLPEDLQAQLNPYTSFSFVPWPNEEQVRKGALASLSFIADQGIDPENYDPELEKQRKEQEEEERRQREDKEREEREERDKKIREEQMRRAEIERANREREQAEALRRGSGGAGGAPPSMSPTVEKQGQFKFMDDDDDSDD